MVENEEYCDKVIKEILEHWDDDFDVENEQINDNFCI